MSRWLALLFLVPVACEEGEPPQCELEDRATCISSLRVAFSDQRTDFILTLTDGVALDGFTISCPGADTNDLDSFQWTCTEGGVIIDTDLFYGDDLTVIIDAGQPETYPLNITRGGDRCGNVCTNASLTLEI